MQLLDIIGIIGMALLVAAASFKRHYPAFTTPLHVVGCLVIAVYLALGPAMAIWAILGLGLSAAVWAD